MSDERIVIPVASDVTLEDLFFLDRTHAEIGLELSLKGAKRRVGYGSQADTPEEAHRAVAELLRIARFALLVREAAAAQPTASAAEVIAQVHQQMRSRT